MKFVKPDLETRLFTTTVNLFDIYVSKKVIDFCCDPQLHEKIIGGNLRMRHGQKWVSQSTLESVNWIVFRV